MFPLQRLVQFFNSTRVVFRAELVLWSSGSQKSWLQGNTVKDEVVIPILGITYYSIMLSGNEIGFHCKVQISQKSDVDSCVSFEPKGLQIRVLFRCLLLTFSWSHRFSRRCASSRS